MPLNVRLPKSAPAKALRSMLACALGASVLVVPGSAGADDNPATSAFQGACLVERQFSEGTVIGADRVAPGEVVTFVNQTSVGAGTVYQDILQRPDGSVYYASVFTTTAPATSGLTVDAASVSFSINGAPQALVPATSPQPGAWAYNTVANSDGSTTWQVFFPGDEAAMIAEQSGAGVESYTSAGPSTFRFAFNSVVNTDAPSHTVMRGASCLAAVSTGPSNRNSSELSAQVAYTPPTVQIEKNANLETVSAGSTVEYTIDLASLALVDGAIPGPAFDVAVVDTLPPGIDPVNAAGDLVVDGGDNGAGGIWNTTARTLTFAISELVAGGSEKIVYRAKVTTDTPGEYLNTATVSATSAPGVVDGEALYPDLDIASDAVVMGGLSPTVAKSAWRDQASLGLPIGFTVDVTIPAGLEFHDVTIVDTLPDGLELIEDPDPLTLVCVSGCESDPAPTRLADFESPAGWHRVGYWLGNLPNDGNERQYQLVYMAQLADQLASGSVPALGAEFTNVAEVNANLVPRLGGVVADLADLQPTDTHAESPWTVTYARPILSIEKSVASPSEPYDPSPDAPITWTISVTNSGNAPAAEVVIADYVPVGFEDNYDFSQLPPNVYAGDGRPLMFEIPSVAPEETVTFSYSATPSGAGVIDVTRPIRNDATVRSYWDLAGDVRFTTTESVYTETDPSAPVLEMTKRLLSSAAESAGSEFVSTWELVITNVGTGTAHNLEIEDTFGDDQWTYVDGSVSAGVDAVAIAGGVTLTSAVPLAPGAATTITYQTHSAGSTAGTKTNQAVATATDGVGRSTVRTDAGTGPISSSASASLEVVAPTLVVSKLPNAEDQARIVEGGNANFTVTITNDGPVRATNITALDSLPDGLVFNPGQTVVVAPSGLSGRVTSPTAATENPEFLISHLEPGETIRFSVPVTNDTFPADRELELVNTVDVQADGSATVSDTGSLYLQPSIQPPSVRKSVSPEGGAPRTAVTYTINVTIPDQASPVFDVAMVDLMPDGIEFVSYGAVTCVSGNCAGLEYPSGIAMAPSAQPNGSTDIGWFFGDYPATGGPAELELIVNGIVETTFDDTTGVRPTNTPVQDGLFDPLINRARAYMNSTDVLSTVSTAPASPNAEWSFRSAPAVAPFDVQTPTLVLTKVASDNAVSSGDPLTYTIRIENTGSVTAFDAVLIDDGGEQTANSAGFESVNLGLLPPGVTITDSFSTADPDMQFTIAEIAPGEVIEFTYDVDMVPSSQLFPATSGDSRDTAALTNIAQVTEYFATDGGAGTGAQEFEGEPVVSTVTVYTPVPYIYASQCANVGARSSQTLNIYLGNVSNSAYTLDLTPNAPGDGNDGRLVDPVVSITIPGALAVTGAAITYPGSAAQTIFPTSTVNNSDGTATLSFDLNDLPLTASPDTLLQVLVSSGAAAVSAPITASIVGSDASGAGRRGDAVAAEYTYASTRTTNCPGVVPELQPVLVKTPDRTLADTAFVLAPGQVTNFTVAFDDGTGSLATPAINPIITDVLPDGLTYTPGSATFTVGSISGVTGPTITETISPLPGGRTQIQWSGWASITGLRITIPVRIDDDVPTNTVLTNSVELDADNAYTTSCVNPGTLCDTGSIAVVVAVNPTLDKTVNVTNAWWGDVLNYTIDVYLPAGQAYTDAVVADVMTNSRNIPVTNVTPVSAQCIDCPSGAGITGVFLPYPGTSTLSSSQTQWGWSFGDIPASASGRTLRIRYDITVPSEEAAYNGNVLYPAYNTYLQNQARFLSHSVSDAGAGNGYEADPADPLWFSKLWALGPNGSPPVMITRAIDSQQVTITNPDLNIAKDCGSSFNDSISMTVAGANVFCQVTLTNPSNRDVYNAVFTDDLGDIVQWYASSQYGTTDPEVEFMGVEGDLTIVTPWDGDKITLQTGSGAIPAGGSVTYTLKFRWDPWSDQPAIPEYSSAQISRPWARVRNAVDLQSFTGSPDDRYPIRTTRGAFTEIYAHMPQLKLHKAAISNLLLDGESSLAQDARDDLASSDRLANLTSCEKVESGSGWTDIAWCDSPIRPVTGTHRWLLELEIWGGQASFSNIDVIDRLPHGYRYVPGTARVVSGDRNPITGELTSTRYVIGDPSVTAAPPTGQCDVSTPPWPDGLFDTELNEDGDRLAWSFRSDATDWRGSLWDNERSRMIDSDPVYGSTTYWIEFDTDISGAQDCLRDAGLYNGWAYNDAETFGTPLLGDAVHSAGRSWAEISAPMQMTKTPDDGAVIDGSTAWFTIETKWFAPQQPPQSFVITDTVQDANPLSPTGHMYQPRTAQVEMIAADGNTVSVGYTESIVRSATGSTVTWTLDPGFFGSGSGTFDGSGCLEGQLLFSTQWSSYCIAPMTVIVRMPLAVPEDTPDGTPIPNEAEVNVVGVVDQWGLGAVTQTATDEGHITVHRPADPPAITKTGPASGRIGDLVTWDMSFTLPARDVWFDLSYQDILPAGVEFTGYGPVTCTESDGDSCVRQLGATTMTPEARSDGTTALGWYLGDVPGEGIDRVVTFQVYGRILDDANNVDGTVLTNQVQGYSNDTDKITTRPEAWPAVTWDNTSPVDTADTTITEPDLSLVKTPITTGPLAEGDRAEWSLTLTNSGTGTAYGVSLTDRANAAVEAVTVDSITSTGPNTARLVKGWTTADPALKWFVGAIAPGESITIAYHGTVITGYADLGLSTADNAATMSGYSSLPGDVPGARDYEGAEDQATIPLISPRITIEKFAGADCAGRQQGFTVGVPNSWCLRVANTGTATATAVTVEDVLPFGWTYVTGSSIPDVTAETTAAQAGPTLTWELGDLPADAAVVITYQTVATADSATKVDNLASASALLSNGSQPTFRAVAYSDADTAAAEQDVAMLEISKIPDEQIHGFLPSSGTLTWDIVVTNPGVITTNNVIVTDDLPAGLTYTAGSATCVGTCNDFVETIAGPAGSGASGTTPIAWTLSSLGAGESATITLTALVPGGSSALARYLNHVAAASDEVTTVENQAKATLYAPAELGNYVWHDANGDGQQSADEDPIGGVTVLLTGVDIEGNPVSLSTETTDDGLYLFADLVPGDYEVRFVASTLPTGFQWTVPTTGDAANDSDATLDGTAIAVSLASGESNLTIDAGALIVGSLGDYVWFDTDADGVQDDTEEPVKGVSVNVRGINSFGVSVDITVVTDADGLWLVENLLPGEYTVTFTAPDGSLFTVPQAGDDRDADSDVDPVTGSTVVTLGSGENRRDVDAGLIEDVLIGDFVWLDADADGIQDEGEDGIDGVEVTITGTDVFGNPVDITVSTDADGRWTQTVLPGTYTVTVATPTGLIVSAQDAGTGDDLDSDIDPTGTTASYVITSGQDDLSIDAGFYELGSIGDRVWIDADADGVQDEGELPLAGVTVRLTGVTGTGETVELTAVTDSAGLYLFDGLIPGSYTVDFIVPGGYVSTRSTMGGDANVDSNPVSTTVSLGSGEHDLTIDHGLIPAGTIGDLVWNDVDADGVADPGEPGIGGVQVELTWLGWDGVAGGGDDLTWTTTTDADGNYLFEVLPPGTFIVNVIAPAGLDQSGDPDGSMDNASTVSLGVGETDLDQDFGYTEVGTIGDYVWWDLDGDGIQDANELPVPGVEVTLVYFGPDGIEGTDDDETFTDTTDANGFYLFEDLMPGQYSVTMTAPEGWVISGDPDGTMDGISTLTLSAGGIDLAQDFGIRGEGSIEGTLWVDTDLDGTIDPNEELIPSITVTLLDADGNVVATTVTGADGSYSFDGLPPGEYTVVVDLDDPEFPAEHRNVFDPDGDGDSRFVVPLAPLENRKNVDFGYAPQPTEPTEPTQPTQPKPAPQPTTPSKPAEPSTLAATGLVGGSLLVLLGATLFAGGGFAGFGARRSARKAARRAAGEGAED